MQLNQTNNRIDAVFLLRTGESLDIKSLLIKV